jgi:type I restriction enzyme S subunit
LPKEAIGCPYIGLEHIGEGTLSLVDHGRAEDVKSVKSRFKKGDILFGKLRPYFRKVIRAPFDGVCSTDIWVVRARQGVDQVFLFYCMSSKDFIEFSTRGSEGTKMPRAKWEFVSKFRISLPPLHGQRAIAHILGSLDDKIELNRRMNETLEAMARAIFKSWFIDFDPVRAKAEGRDPGLPQPIADLFPDQLVDSKLGEIPAGWRVEPFVETIEVIGGGTPKTSVSEYWNGDIPWFSVIDAPLESEVWVIDTEKKISRLGVENSSTRILPVSTTIISARGTVGRVALVGVPMAMNQSCYGLRGKMDSNGFFTYFSTKELVARLRRHAHGSVFDTITRDTLASISFVVPPVEIITTFEGMIIPIMKCIRDRLFESRTLAELRDALLPRLIRDEIRIEDVERFLADRGL